MVIHKKEVHFNKVNLQIKILAVQAVKAHIHIKIRMEVLMCSKQQRINLIKVNLIYMEVAKEVHMEVVVVAIQKHIN